MNKGEKIQFLRKEQKMTQEVFAEKMNVTRQAVSRWEQGISNPDTDTLFLIAKIFNVSVEYLLNDEVLTKEEKDEKNRVHIFNLQTLIIKILLIFGLALSIGITYLLNSIPSVGSVGAKISGLLILIIFITGNALAYIICRSKYIMACDYNEADLRIVKSNSISVIKYASIIFLVFFPLIIFNSEFKFFDFTITSLIDIESYLFIAICFAVGGLIVLEIGSWILGVGKRRNNILLLYFAILFVLTILSFYDKISIGSVFGMQITNTIVYFVMPIILYVSKKINLEILLFSIVNFIIVFTFTGLNNTNQMTIIINYLLFLTLIVDIIFYKKRLTNDKNIKYQWVSATVLIFTVVALIFANLN